MYIVRNYLRDSRRNPIGVAMARVDDAGDNILVGFSLCGKGDRFEYRKANIIALSRMNSGKFQVPLMAMKPMVCVENMVDLEIDPIFHPLRSQLKFVVNDIHSKNAWHLANPRV